MADTFDHPDFQQGQLAALTNTIQALLMHQTPAAQEHTRDVLRKMMDIHETPDGAVLSPLFRDGFRQIAEIIVGDEQRG